MRNLSAVVVAVMAACSSSEGTGPDNTAGSIRVVSGSAQTGIAGDLLAADLVAEVLTVRGQPLGGATIQWSANAGGGLRDATSTTGTDGIARNRWTLGSTVGEQRATARADGRSIDFVATAQPGAPTQVTVVGDTVRVLRPGETSTVALRVTDRHGNTIDGATVAASWASSDTTIATIAADGRIRAHATGVAVITASAAGRSVRVHVEVFELLFDDVSDRIPADVRNVGQTMEVRPGDFDNDGDLDLILAKEFRPNILLLNDGSGRSRRRRAAFPSPGTTVRTSQWPTSTGMATSTS